MYITITHILTNNIEQMDTEQMNMEKVRTDAMLRYLLHNLQQQQKSVNKALDSVFKRLNDVIDLNLDEDDKCDIGDLVEASDTFLDANNKDYSVPELYKWNTDDLVEYANFLLKKSWKCNCCKVCEIIKRKKEIKTKTKQNI